MLEKIKEKLGGKTDKNKLTWDTLPIELRQEFEAEADYRWKQKLDFLSLLGIQEEQGMMKYVPLINIGVTVLLLIIVLFK